MSEMFSLKEYFVREHIGAISLVNQYEIFDKRNKKLIGWASEIADTSIKAQKLFLDKALIPYKLQIFDCSNEMLLEIESPRTLFSSTILVKDKNAKIIGKFVKNNWFMGGGIKVIDSEDLVIGTITGDWWGREYRFCDPSDKEIAFIKHMYGGIFKEALTTADDYEVKIEDPKYSQVILASVFIIDFCYHE